MKTQVKKLLGCGMFLLMAVFIFMMPLSAAAAEYTVTLADGGGGSVELQYSVSNETVTVTGCSAGAVSLVIPAEVEGKPVVAIDNRAFYGCSSLTAVEIPAAVSNVGNDAFRGCTALQTVVFRENKTEGFKRTLGSFAFGDCTALTDVTLSGTSTSLGNDLFNGCTSLSQLTLPEGITHMGYALLRNTAVERITVPASVTSVNSYYSYGGNGPFAGCTTLKEVVFAEGTTRIWSYFCAMNDTECNIEKVVIPDGVTHIDYRAFHNCKNLPDVDLPASLTVIDAEAFYGCTSLTEVEIPAAVSNVGNDAFRGCTALQTVVFRENKTEGFKRTLGSFAFGDCTALTDVTLSGTSTSLGNDLFNGCTSLSQLNLPAGITHMGYALLRNTAVERITVPASVTGVNSYYSYGGNGPFAGCTTLKEVVFAEGTTRIWSNFCAMSDTECNIEKVVIPDGVTHIDYRAFQNCKNLQSIDLPASLAVIDAEAFYGCSTLTEVEIPAAVSNVGNDAFRGCTALQTVVFRENKTEGFKRTLGSYAFGDCTALTDVTLSGTSASLGNDLFNGCTSLSQLTLPEGITHMGYSMLRNTAVERITVPASVSSVSSYYSYGGNGPFAGCTTLKEVVFAEGTTRIWSNFCAMSDTECNVEKVVIPDGVTHIDYRAFQNCKNLQSIDLPASLAVIDAEAFYGCSTLTEVEIPAAVNNVGNDAFRGCTSLQTVVFRENKTEGFKRTLGSYAFGDCTALIDVTLSGTSTSLGNDLFNGCTSLSQLTLPEGITHMGYSMLRNTAVERIKVPASVSSVNSYYSYGGNGPFAGCTTLKEVVFAEGTTRIWSNFCAMSDTECNVEKVVIPDGVTHIDYRAFQNCKNLQSIDLPASLAVIDAEAFYGCSTLTEVEIPAAVNNVGNDAFRGCTALKTVVFRENKSEGFKRTLGSYAFGDCTALTDVTLSGTSTSLGNDLFNGCTLLSQLTLPEGITHMGYSMLRNTAVERITVPASVSSVNSYYSYGGNGPFAGCTTLKEVVFAEATTRIWSNFCAMSDTECNIEKVVIPDGVTHIDYRAFQNCGKLKSIVIPKSLTLMEDAAFEGCVSLEKVYIYADALSIHSGTFRNCDKLTIYCEADSSVERYAQENNIPCLDIIGAREDLTANEAKFYYQVKEYRRGYCAFNTDIDFILSTVSGDRAVLTITYTDEEGTAEKHMDMAYDDHLGAYIASMDIVEGMVSIDSAQVQITRGEETQSHTLENSYWYSMPLMVEGTVTVKLSNHFREYAGMKLKLYEESGRLAGSYELGSEKEIVFHGLKPGSALTAMVMAGEMEFARQEDLAVEAGKTVVLDLTQLPQTASLKVRFYSDGREILDEKVKVAFFDMTEGKERLFAVGRELQALAAGDTIGFNVSMSRDFAMNYMVKTMPTSVTLTAGENVAIVELEQVKEFTYRGKLTDEKTGLPVFNALVKVHQMVNGTYPVQQSVRTERDGTFSMTIKDMDATLVISKSAYNTITMPVKKGNYPSALEMVTSGGKIKVSLGFMPAYPENIGGGDVVYEGRPDRVVVYNVTQDRELAGYQNTYPILYTDAENVAEGDVIRAELKRKGYRDLVLEGTADIYGNVELSGTMYELGGIQVSFRREDSKAEAVQGLLFDETGKVYRRFGKLMNQQEIRELEPGTYTLALVEPMLPVGSIDSLAELQGRYQQGEGVALRTDIVVTDGNTVCPATITVPTQMDWPSVLGRHSRLSGDTTAMIGDTVWFTVAVNLDEPQMISEETLHITLPQGVKLTDVTASVNNTRVRVEETEDGLSIPMEISRGFFRQRALLGSYSAGREGPHHRSGIETDLRCRTDIFALQYFLQGNCGPAGSEHRGGHVGCPQANQLRPCLCPRHCPSIFFGADLRQRCADG